MNCPENTKILRLTTAVATLVTLVVTAGAALASATGTGMWRRNGTNNVQYSPWDGSAFGGVASAGNLGPARWLAAAEAPARNEIVLAAIRDSNAEVRVQVWNGSSWGAVQTVANIGGTFEYRAVDVAYEQLSGRAMLVYVNGGNGSRPLSYEVWDGATWSAPADITTPQNGAALHLYLAAKPNSNEMVLVAGNAAGESYAMVWNGSSWGNGVTLETLGVLTDFNAAYEQQSGNAMVVYGAASLGGAYRTWNGSTWSAAGAFSAPAGESLAPRWFVTATDPNSDRVALGVLTWGDGSNSHVWLDVWDGSAWQTPQTATTTQNPDMLYPSVGVAFERWRGRALAVYMPNTSTDIYDYRLWTVVGGWSSAMSGPDINANAHAIHLEHDPYSNAIMLSSVDSDSDINFALWNGASWDPRVEMDSDAGTNLGQPIAFAFDRPLTYDISGVVFEDVNYGGGSGRDRPTAAADAPGFTVERDGAIVEIYDDLGDFLGSITTGNGGRYSFNDILPGTYTLRVVNSSVRSGRPGSDGSELGVQTWRADGSSEGAGTGATRVGGEQPALVDAPANNGSQTLAAIQAAAGQYTQSLVTLVLAGANLGDVDFGFNFDTIVNTGDAGQGSLRQFIVNANVLAGNSQLDQDALVPRIESSVFMIPGAGDPFGRPADPNYNVSDNGEYRFQPLSAYPMVSDTLAIDGYTQIGSQPCVTPFPGVFDAVIPIEINGDLSGGANLFDFAASGSALRGVVVNGGFNNAVTITGDDCAVTGVRIGTDVPGATVPLPSPNRAVVLGGSQSSTIGGATPAQRNVISGNAIAGIEATSGAIGATVRGNYIGSDDTGTAALGNGDGIRFVDASSCIIGGTGAGDGNLIAFNDSTGISVLAGSGNTMSRNSIHSNGLMGIDLGADGVTTNDAGDSDAGLQNFPAMSFVNVSGGDLTIVGTLSSTPNTALTVEFFGDTVADPTGYGEGRSYLGSIGVNTDASGNAPFSTTLAATINKDDMVTATATGAVDGTSEFGQSTTVTGISTVTLVDSTATSYPADVSIADPSVSVNIGMNNLTPIGVMLNTTSTIEFSDGVNAYVANLANPTYVPGNARGFTMAFAAAPLPPAIAAGVSYDFTLVLHGLDDVANVYADSITTTGRNSIFVRDIRVGVMAAPLQAQAIHPGDRGKAILALSFANGYATPRALDTLVVTNMSAGPGTQPELDAEFESLFLYDDVDSSYSLTVADTVVSQGGLVAGRTAFAVAGTWSIPAASRRALIVVADIDSSAARDADVLDAAVLSPSDVIFGAGTVVEPDFSPLFPLDSFGDLTIDGMMAHQVYVVPSSIDTLYAGDTNVHVATVHVPPNGYNADVLTQLAIRDYAPDFSPTDLVLKLFRDTGDGVFNALTDVSLGTMVYSGDRYAISGLSEPVGSGQTFFVVADVSPFAPNGDHFRPGVPVDGIAVGSGNDGPIDSDVIVPKSFFIRNIELINVVNLPVAVAPLHPGDTDAPLLSLSVHNSTLQVVTLDTLRLVNTSTGPGTQSDLDNSFSSLRIYRDDGNGMVGPADSLLVGGLRFSGGACTITGLGCTLGVGEMQRLLIAADIDSTCTADGTVVQAQISTAADLGFDVSAVINGSFPMATQLPSAIDGMMLFQMAHFARPDSIVITGGSDILLLDFGLPANGYSADVLQTIKIFNEGTATTEHLDRIALYFDGGDNVFDHGLGDDTYVGDFFEDLTIPGGRAFKIQGLTLPLATTCGGHTRFFVAADIGPDYSVGGSIRMSVPLKGITVASGNDGPIDAALAEPSTQIIPKPDQLTLFPYPIDDRTSYPGSAQNVNFALGVYNGYNTVATLKEFTVFQIGTATGAEIDSVFLYADADTNGLFNPAVDTRISAIKSMGASYHFDNLTYVLPEGKVSTLFASYNLPLAVTDSVSVNLQLFDAQSFVVDPPTLDIQGDFPINSAGVDIVNGMVAVQIAMGTAPAFVAAAGDPNTLAMSLTLPGNGLWDDVLKSIAIRNMGTAVSGTDITGFYLWKEGGGHPQKFDAVNDIPLGPLDWNGTRWKNTIPFDETVPKAGLRVYVTFGTSALPTDGATVKARIGTNGIQMASGNDGPLDDPVTNSVPQELSTDPLISVLTTDNEIYSTTQPIELLMFVRNEGVDTLYGVTPSAIATNGTATVGFIAGPVPASVDLLPGADTFFLWSYAGLTAGSIEFCGSAHTADGLVVSRSNCTAFSQIQNRPVNVPVTLTNSAPASVNRGQSGITMLRVNVDYQGAGSQNAPINLDGVRMIVEDGAGVPVPPNQLFVNANLLHSAGSAFKLSVVDSSTNPLHLVLAQPMVLQPGQFTDISAVFDISPTATNTPYRIRLQTLGDVLMFDPNDGNAVTATSPNTFPWRTTLVTVNNPAESLLVDSGSGTTVSANTGQKGLSMFSFDVVNKGAPASATELLTELEFSFVDTAGTGIFPDGAVRRLAVRSGTQVLFQTTQVPTSASTMRVNLTTPLLIAAGLANTLTVDVDVADTPSVPGFSMRLEDPSSVVARDINDGHFVVVSAASPGLSDFPFSSDRVIFQNAASGLTAQYVDRLPGSMQPGMSAVRVMDVSLQHGDVAGASSLRVDSLSIAFLNGAGSPLFPGNYFDSLMVVGSQDTLCLFPTLNTAGHVVECRLSTPITLSPGGSDYFSVFLSTKSLYTPGTVQVRLEQSGIVVYDANDGTRGFGITGTFPFVCGPSSLQLMSSIAYADIDSRLPSNLTTQQTNVAAFDFILRNQIAAGVGPVHLKTLHVSVENGKGAVINPSAAVAAARMVTADSTVISGTLGSSDIVFAVPDSLVLAGGSGGDTASVWIDVAASADASFRFSLLDTSAVDVRDVASGTPVSTGTTSGGFPLRTNYANVLGANPSAAFTNYPNPFAAGRQHTTVTYYLDQPSRVTLKLYTIWGAPVATLLEGESLNAGLHQDVLWDGRNGDGNTVNNGVYYLVLEVDPANGNHWVLKRKVGVIR